MEAVTRMQATARHTYLRRGMQNGAVAVPTLCTGGWASVSKTGLAVILISAITHTT